MDGIVLVPTETDAFFIVRVIVVRVYAAANRPVTCREREAPDNQSTGLFVHQLSRLCGSIKFLY